MQPDGSPFDIRVHEPFPCPLFSPQLFLLGSAPPAPRTGLVLTILFLDTWSVGRDPPPFSFRFLTKVSFFFFVSLTSGLPACTALADRERMTVPELDDLFHLAPFRFRSPPSCFPQKYTRVSARSSYPGLPCLAKSRYLFL